MAPNAPRVVVGQLLCAVVVYPRRCLLCSGPPAVFSIRRAIVPHPQCAPSPSLSSEHFLRNRYNALALISASASGRGSSTVWASSELHAEDQGIFKRRSLRDWSPVSVDPRRLRVLLNRTRPHPPWCPSDLERLIVFSST